MFEEIKKYCDEINLILEELQQYESYKLLLEKNLNALKKLYLSKKISYDTYQEKKRKILGLNQLKEESEAEQIRYYEAYILSLLRKIEFANSQIFSTAYNDKSTEFLRISTPESSPEVAASPIPREEAKTETQMQTKISTPKLTKLQTVPAKKKSEVTEIGIKKKEQEKPLPQKKQVYEAEDIIITATEEQKITPTPKITPKQVLSLGEKTEDEKSLPINAEILPQDAVISKEQNATKDFYGPDDQAPRPNQKEMHKIPKPKKGGLFAKKERTDINLGSVLSFKTIKDMLSRQKEKQKFISEKTNIGQNLLKLGNKSKEKQAVENENINASLLSKEAEHLKNIMHQRKIKIYDPTSLGFISNITVRKLSLYLLDNFPEFFSDFYKRIRFANIQILSNTYINIMVFISTIIFFLTFIITSAVSMAFGNTIFYAMAKSFLFASISVVISVFLFYYYPEMKIKERRRSINTNLPFAIDHIASVTASGVPPASMFRLIAQAKEYGEVSLEIAKISNFIDIFGYDIITSIRSVSATTPSEEFKEFLEGFLSTIETGGSLKNYLRQKSEETMRQYSLERQRYLESIAIYSDIYTGLLVAAPLFFVSALSLVSMLGGKVGGIEVDSLVAIGVYAVIPAMNILFVVFLELNQPEV